MLSMSRSHQYDSIESHSVIIASNVALLLLLIAPPFAGKHSSCLVSECQREHCAKHSGACLQLLTACRPCASGIVPNDGFCKEFTGKDNPMLALHASGVESDKSGRNSELVEAASCDLPCF